MPRSTSALLAGLAALSLASACASLAGSEFDRGLGASNDAGASGAAAPSGVDAPAGPVDNAVILVHASRDSAFRLCFSNFPDLRPQPDSEVMPQANVVGVDVGSTVRLPPLPGPPGDVILFPEPLIRPLYPPGVLGASCKDLRANAGAFEHVIGHIDTDLSTGVHLVIVSGCPSTTTSRPLAECGAGYDGGADLRVTERTVAGAARSSTTELPTQLIHLAEPLELERGTNAVTVGFGELDAGADAEDTSIVAPKYLGPDTSFTPSPRFDVKDDGGVFDLRGFRVHVGPAVVFGQSLADIQRVSSPRDVPSNYYANASNYVLLLLGDPAPKVSDGGPDADPRRNLHFLAIPVALPHDAGADAQ